MEKLVCGFCSKSEGEVARLMIGLCANICNECVALCLKIFKDEEENDRGIGSDS